MRSHVLRQSHYSQRINPLGPRRYHVGDARRRKEALEADPDVRKINNHAAKRFARERREMQQASASIGEAEQFEWSDEEEMAPGGGSFSPNNSHVLSHPRFELLRLLYRGTGPQRVLSSKPRSSPSGATFL